MGKGRALTKLAAIGAAIGGAVFFWRKRQAKPAADGTTTAPPQFPPAADGK